MKNANGSGSVHKVSDRRRKPWKAVVTIGMEYDAEKGRVVQRRKIVGYFKTRTDAQNALANFRQNPYDIDGRKITFAEMYERWSSAKFERVSASKIRGYKSAYNHAAPLHSMAFNTIRPAHIEKCMREADVGSTTKNNIKQLCNQLYKFAIKSELATTNYAAMCEGVPEDAPTIIRAPFTDEEEAVLWENLDIPYVDMVLIGMYSGWRPQELAILESKNVDLEERTFSGGIKTKAGKNRVVPIHPKISPLVENWVLRGTDRLFTDEAGKPLSYNTYKTRFDRLKKRFGWNHMPHDVRHTFVTKAKEAGMNEWILKLIVGHAIDDLTEKVYTHRRIEELRAEMDKIS